MDYSLPKGISLSQYIKNNSEKFHALFPTNPTISKDDDWGNEDIWDELYEKILKNKWRR